MVFLRPITSAALLGSERRFVVCGVEVRLVVLGYLVFGAGVKGLFVGGGCSIMTAECHIVHKKSMALTSGLRRTLRTGVQFALSSQKFVLTNFYFVICIVLLHVNKKNCITKKRATFFWIHSLQ